MTATHITGQMLEDIDARLLNLLRGPRTLADADLQKVATLESARGAVQRLLAAAEEEVES